MVGSSRYELVYVLFFFFGQCWSTFRRRDKHNLPHIPLSVLTRHSVPHSIPHSPHTTLRPVGLRCRRTGRVYMDNSHTETTLRSSHIARTPSLALHPKEKSYHQALTTLEGSSYGARRSRRLWERLQLLDSVSRSLQSSMCTNASIFHDL